MGQTSTQDVLPQNMFFTLRFFPVHSSTERHGFISIKWANATFSMISPSLQANWEGTITVVFQA